MNSFPVKAEKQHFVVRLVPNRVFYGDGSVSGGDFGAFRLAFGTSTGQAGYVDYLDFEGNGAISGGDFGNFRIRFGTTVP